MPVIIAVAEPPAQYTHRFNGPVIERVLPLAEARRACGRMGVWSDACAWTKGGKCYIVIPSNGPVRDLNAYRRHEIAHCNGWDHHHGGSSTATAQRWLSVPGAAAGRSARRSRPSTQAPTHVPPTAY
jgi:hypothetical protein